MLKYRSLLREEHTFCQRKSVGHNRKESKQTESLVCPREIEKDRIYEDRAIPKPNDGLNTERMKTKDLRRNLEQKLFHIFQKYAKCIIIFENKIRIKHFF